MLDVDEETFGRLVQARLLEADAIVIRLLGDMFLPEDWQDYLKKLRALRAAPSCEAIPKRPPYPTFARPTKPDDITWPSPTDRLSDWDQVGEGVSGASNVPAEIAELMEPGETLTHDVRRKLTERLNVELAELKNLRGLAGEDLKREAEIEKLLGLFARLGEI